MLTRGLIGIYHVVSGERLSKYEFGERIARRFGLDEKLITPVPVEQSGLKAARSQLLTLRTEKLATALGMAPPGIDPGIERFYQLFLDGYPKRLRQMAAGE